MTLKESIKIAKKNYSQTKEEYLNNPSKENFIKFCDAKRVCMLLGVRI